MDDKYICATVFCKPFVQEKIYGQQAAVDVIIILLQTVSLCSGQLKHLRATAYSLVYYS